MTLIQHLAPLKELALPGFRSDLTLGISTWFCKSSLQEKLEVKKKLARAIVLIFV